MTEKIDRRRFFILAGRGLRKPIGIAFLLAVTWLIISAVQAARGITLYGWALMGCLVLAGIILGAIRLAADRVYHLLPSRGKALCAAAGEAANMLALAALGGLLWRQWQSDNAPVITGVIILNCTVHGACKAYRQRMAGGSESA